MGKNRYSRFCQAILVLMIPSWLICEISVNAAVQTVIVSEPPAIVNFSGREIELPQFNPSLGSLESVTIDVKGTGALLQGFNHSGGPGSNRDLSGQPLLGL